jgi:hypothetical protein
MLSSESIRELQSAWLPNMTDAALRRLIELLANNSPLLIHGAFTRSVPMGCLATQAAWNHPQTARLTQDAGILWLHHVAGLNPATSQVIRAWDDAAGNGYRRFVLRQELLGQLRDELQRREAGSTARCDTAVVEV